MEREDVEPGADRREQRSPKIADAPEQLVQRRQRRRHLDRPEPGAVDRGAEGRRAAHVTRVAEAEPVLDRERLGRGPPPGRGARGGTDSEDRLERLRRAQELGANPGRRQPVDPILPAHVIPAVGTDLVPLGPDRAQQRRHAGADEARRQERAREERADAVEPERVGPPHLREEAWLKRAPEREPRAVGPHRHEERGARPGPPEELEQARHALLEPPPRVDVHPQRYCRLNHSMVRESPSSSGTSARTESSSCIRRRAGTRRGMSS